MMNDLSQLKAEFKKASEENANVTWNKRADIINKIKKYKLYLQNPEHIKNSFNDWLKEFCKENEVSYYTIMHERTEAELLQKYADYHNKNYEKQISSDDVAKLVNFKSAQSISRIRSAFEKESKTLADAIAFELILRTGNQDLNSYRLSLIAGNVTEARRILKRLENGNKAKQKLEVALLHTGSQWLPNQLSQDNREITDNYIKIKVNKAPCYRIYAVPDIQLNYDALVIENHTIEDSEIVPKTGRAFEEVNIHGLKLCPNRNIDLNIPWSDKSLRCLDCFWLVFENKGDADKMSDQDDFFNRLFSRLPTLKAIGVIYFDGKCLHMEKVFPNTVTNSQGDRLDRLTAKNALMSAIFIGLIPEVKKEDIPDENKKDDKGKKTDKDKALEKLNTHYKISKIPIPKKTPQEIHREHLLKKLPKHVLENIPKDVLEKQSERTLKMLRYPKAILIGNNRVLYQNSLFDMPDVSDEPPKPKKPRDFRNLRKDDSRKKRIATEQKRISADSLYTLQLWLKQDVTDEQNLDHFNKFHLARVYLEVIKSIVPK